MRVCVGVTMLSAWTLHRLSCFLLVSRVSDISSGIGPCLPLAGGFCSRYADAGGKWPMLRQPHLVQHKQQANLLLSMHSYTPLLISRNYKNKQLTKVKPTQTRIKRKKYVNSSVHSEEHLKKLKTRRDTYSGLYLSIDVIKSPIHLVRQSL